MIDDFYGDSARPPRPHPLTTGTSYGNLHSRAGSKYHLSLETTTLYRYYSTVSTYLFYIK